MAKLIALDWDARQLRIAVANHSGGKTVLEEVRSLQIVQDDEEDGDAREANLIAAIASAKIGHRGAETLVATRRADVELRLINLPPIPGNELPDIVRMQSQREFSELSEDWTIDFLTLHADAQETVVLAAAIPPQRLSSYRRIVEASDLKPARMVLRPTATALIVSQLDESPRPAVEICIEDLGHACEMSVLREGTPVLIRTVQSPPSDRQDRARVLADEIRRTSMAAANQLRGKAAERVVLFGSAADQAVVDQIQHYLNVPVRTLDPFHVLSTSNRLNRGTIENAGQFAAAIGMLAGHDRPGQDATLIDFLNPRKAPPPTSSKHLVLGSLIAGLLIGFLAIGGFWMHINNLEQETRRLQLQAQAQQTVVEEAEVRIDELRQVERWTEARVNWMELLSDVSIHLPPAENVRIGRWYANILSNGNGQLVLKGIADEQSTIAQIDKALRKENRRVFPAGGEFEDRDQELPWRFEQTVTLETETGIDSAQDQRSATRSTIGRR